MVEDTIHHKTEWTITKYADDEAYKRDEPYERVTFWGNVLLNEGISRLHNLLTGGGGNDYGNATAYVGVGEDNTAAVATQTGLQGATLTYKAMEATYPTYASQVTTWRGVFGSGDANNAWNEFTVVNAATDAGDNLNRVVSAQGSKTSGQVWTLDVKITWS